MVSSLYLNKGIKNLAIIGNYLPRRCGIATFTADLVEAITAESPGTDCWVVAMNDTAEGYNYPDSVCFMVNQNALPEYRLVAGFLNMNKIDLVCLQHEYGIFGGKAGANILELLRQLGAPIVTTLHTILEDPSPEQRTVLERLVHLSSRLVTMSKKGSELLRDIYDVPDEKIAFVHHGIPDVPFADPNFYKDQFGVKGRKVILTFGLLSQDKGIEYVIQALPRVVDKHPDVVYIILGATHPHVKKVEGEAYRLGLQRMAIELGVDKHVIFHSRFVETQELCEMLGSSDIYITPYLKEAQVISGTLAYALGAGNAIISTPYWYAVEMLDDGRGKIIPFRNSEALAKEINHLLEEETKRHAMRKRAYKYGREMVWKKVAGRYLGIFEQVLEERRKFPKPVFKAMTLENTSADLPELNLNHLKRLTDDTGMFQHATFSIPNPAFGYCTDDNARALIVALKAQEILPDDSTVSGLITRYLTFLQYAFNEKKGRFRNFMSYDRRWLEETGSDDSHARALWGLGVTVATAKHDTQVGMALNLFERALPAVEGFKFPRSWTFALVGIHEYLRKFSGDSKVRNMRRILGGRLYNQFKENATKDWPWPENCLTYTNARLAHALLLSGQWLQKREMIEMGLRALDWLATIQTSPEGCFSPIGNKGWYPRGGEKARFDQQPIEAQAMIDACSEAHNITRDSKWESQISSCFNWFLGKNDLEVPLCDHVTGGCKDGLQPDGANENQGAESTLAWLLSLTSLHIRQVARLSKGRD